MKAATVLWWYPALPNFAKCRHLTTSQEANERICLEDVRRGAIPQARDSDDRVAEAASADVVGRAIGARVGAAPGDAADPHAGDRPGGRGIDPGARPGVRGEHDRQRGV